MGRLFGTDGVRGLANGHLTAELALDLSVAAARVLADRGEFAGHRPLAVVGRDTRISGQFLEAAVVAGLASAGVDVLRLGVLPTPGVAYLTDPLGADFGVMISASHNPMPDNGIKFLARGGHKLDDAAEIAIEQRLGEEWERPVGADVGRVEDHPTAVAEYAAHLVRSIDHPLRRAARRPRLRRGRRVRRRPAGAQGRRRRRDRDPRDARRPQHQRRLRVDPPRVAARGRAQGRRRRRLRPRRRRRPLPGGRPHRRGRRRRPDPRRPRARPARQRPAGQGHRRRHRDEQPRLRAGDARRGRRRAADQGRRPLRARGDAGLRLLPRRRAVGPRDHDRPRDHRRRHPDRAAPARADGHHRPEPARRSPA